MDYFGEREEPPTSITPADESFSQVIFPNVEKVYPPKTDLQCKFHRTESLLFHFKDWIGIFKVGWKNTTEYFTWTRAGEEDSVLFKGYYLPRDDDFYQFCYVDHNGEVRGASIPFQLCHNVPEDEYDILMVTTEAEMMKKHEENAELKKVVEKLTEERSLLQEKVSSLQNENQAQAEKIQNLQKDLLRPTETIQRLQTENMELTVQAKNLEEEKERMNETIQSLHIDLQMLRNQEEKLLSEMKEMERSQEKVQEEKKLFEKLQIRIKSLDAEKENLETELRRYRENEQKLLSDMKELEKSLEKSLAEKHQFQSEAAAKQKVVENVTYTLNQCKEDAIKLKAELELQACTLEKEKNQKENLRQSLDKEVKKVQDQERYMAQMSEKQRAAEETVINLHKQIDSLKAENENKMKQMRTLHINITHLEDEVKRMKEECKMEAERTEREARTRIQSTEERMESLELQLADQQDTCRLQGEEILTLRSALEIREEEIRDFRDIHQKDRTEIDGLHSRLLGRGSTASFPPREGLIFGNPYEGNDPSFSREYGSRTSSTSRRPRSPLSCPICRETFSSHQILEDHVMSHYEEEARQ